MINIEWKHHWSNSFKKTEFRIIGGIKVLKVTLKKEQGIGWKRPYYLIGDMSFPTLKRAKRYTAMCSAEHNPTR